MPPRMPTRCGRPEVPVLANKRDVRMDRAQGVAVSQPYSDRGCVALDLTQTAIRRSGSSRTALPEAQRLDRVDAVMFASEALVLGLPRVR
jgi:hypothetical protein